MRLCPLSKVFLRAERNVFERCHDCRFLFIPTTVSFFITPLFPFHFTAAYIWDNLSLITDNFPLFLSFITDKIFIFVSFINGM